MSVVVASIEIAAPPERVWEVVMDPRRLGDWVTIHRKLGTVSEIPLREGSTMEQTMALAGAPFHVRWQVTELDPGRRAVWEGRGPARSRAHTTYELTASDGGTRFDYRNEFKAPGGPIGIVADRVLVHGLSEREAHRTLERLKELLEG